MPYRDDSDDDGERGCFSVIEVWIIVIVCIAVVVVSFARCAG